MANNTFRRQPISHSTPSDDTKLWHINNFKGIQQLENPLVADPNSAYTANNVFRNDVGNLTIRPRLEASGKSPINESGEILGYWEYNDRYFWYTSTALKTTGYELAIDGSKGCTMQIYDSKPYFLVFKNNLQLYKFTTAFELVTGEVQFANNITESYYYNMLNNKINIGEIIPILPDSINTFGTGIDDLTMIEDISKHATLDISDIGLSNNQLLTRLTKLSDNCYICIHDTINKRSSNNLDVTVFTYSNMWNKRTYTLTYPGYGGLLANDTDIGYVFDNTNIIVNTIANITHFDARVELTIRQFYIPLTLGDMYIIEKTNNIVFPITPTSDYPNIGLGIYSATILGNTYIFSVDSYTFKNSSQNVGESKWYDVKYNIDTDTSIISETTIENSLGLSYSKYSAYITPDTSVIFCYPPGYGYPTAVYAYVKNGDIIKRINIKALFNLNDSVSSIYTRLSKYGILVYRNDVYNSFILSSLISDSYIGFNHTSRSIVSFVDTTITLATTDSLFQFDIYNTDVIYEWQDKSSSLDFLGLFANNMTTILRFTNTSHTVLLFQVYINGVQGKIEYRPTNNYPLLSDLSANILDSFFIDNTYWFVTDKYVFGTNFNTIEFFDYNKYYELSKPANAAIRISDTSFWVFYEDGAYLIYKSTASGDTTELSQQQWRITQTAQSNSCGFKNAVTTLPAVGPTVASIVTVTPRDISYVTMRKYMQTDERFLQALTTKIPSKIRDIIDQTKEYDGDVKLASYKYLTLFAFNINTKASDNTIIPKEAIIVVFDSQFGEWWIWRFPAKRIYQLKNTPNNIDIMLKTGNSYSILNLAELETEFQLNTRTMEIYADIIGDPTKYENIRPIDWYWESALSSFGTMDFRKQLLQTMFTFTDIDDESDANCEYSFKVYRKAFVKTDKVDVQTDVQLAKNKYQRTYIATYNFLQLVLQNVERKEYMEPGEILETCTKPKLASITCKYRYLPGIGAR